MLRKDSLRRRALTTTVRIKTSLSLEVTLPSLVPPPGRQCVIVIEVLQQVSAVRGGGGRREGGGLF